MNNGSNGMNVYGNVVELPALNAQALAAIQNNQPQAAGMLAQRRTGLLRCGELYGASAPMQHLFQMISKVAPTSANVLISGESGTGKELVASVIHEMSKEKNMPFIALNCSAVTAQLIEAELFGHERDSFTGAVRMHKGCFERADGGTLFLDEVTEMSPEMQVKLLRVLETGRFSRIGGDEEIQVKVRVIAATNRNTQDAVDSGVLRRDLFYRLAVFPIDVPTVRERGEDIELLAKLFLNRLNDEENITKTLSKSSRRFILEYHWPGNVLELKNVVHRAFILDDQELDINSPHDCVTFPLGSMLADAEQRLIFATLGHCGGNKTLTAEVLGVSLKTLYNRLNEYQARVLANAAAHHAKLNSAGVSA